MLQFLAKEAFTEGIISYDTTKLKTWTISMC